MSLLINKGWMAQDYYNQYLSLKYEIGKLTTEQLVNKRIGAHADVCEQTTNTLNERIKQLHFVVQQLTIVCGIDMMDLLMLSIGVDVWDPSYIKPNQKNSATA